MHYTYYRGLLHSVKNDMNVYKYSMYVVGHASERHKRQLSNLLFFFYRPRDLHHHHLNTENNIRILRLLHFLYVKAVAVSK